jgi:hypothetical protein
VGQFTDWGVISGFFMSFPLTSPLSYIDFPEWKVKDYFETVDDDGD